MRFIPILGRFHPTQIPKYIGLRHPRFSPAIISTALLNYSMRFVHFVPHIENSVYAMIRLCRCSTHHTNLAVSVRSLRRRPYRMKPTAIGFINLTTVNFVASQWWCIRLLMGLLPDTLRMRRECRERFPPPPVSKETAS